MRTSSRNLAAVLFPEVELLDVAGALQVFTLAGRQWNFRPFRVWTVASEPGLLETRNQIRVEARHPLDACPAPEVLLVPGGYGARRALSDGALVAWLGSAAGAAEHVLAVGNGVLLLARAGLLAGVSVAAPPEAREALLELEPGASLAPEPTTRAGKLRLAATPHGGLELALDVVGETVGDRQARQVAAAVGLDWGRPGRADQRLRIDLLPPQPTGDSEDGER